MGVARSLLVRLLQKKIVFRERQTTQIAVTVTE